MKYFRDLDVEMCVDAVIILDLDGTVLIDGADDVLLLEKERLEALKTVSKKIICVSNGPTERTIQISKSHDLIPYTAPYRKPNKIILQEIYREYVSDGETVIVVGDKFLTDGLLAVQGKKTRFIHVKSLQGGSESFITRALFSIDDMFGKIFDYIRMMRPRQWIKNILVFAPVFFAGAVSNGSALLAAFWAFTLFSISASLIYVINDIYDADADRRHGLKKWRPIPSSNLSVTDAKFLAMILFVSTVAGLWHMPSLYILMSMYIVVNLFYTIYLKTIPVVDVVLIAFMYVMRVLAGSFATGIPLSFWIVSCTFFASLFLISCKRYVEFQNPVRAVLDKYTKESLQKLLIISAGLSLVSYILYTVLGTGSIKFLYTTPFVMGVFGVMLRDIFSHKADLETPELYLFKNKLVFILILGWIVSMYFLVYNV